MRLAVGILRDAPAEGWGGKAGSLEWECRETAEHLGNDLLYCAVQLGPQSPPLDTHVPFVLSRKRPDGPAVFLSAKRDAGPAGLVQLLEACGALLVAMVRTSPPQVRAHHAAGVSSPEGFAALGLQETLVHTHDPAEGFGLARTPPSILCSRVLARLFPEPPGGAACGSPCCGPQAAPNCRGTLVSPRGARTAHRSHRSGSTSAAARLTMLPLPRRERTELLVPTGNPADLCVYRP